LQELQKPVETPTIVLSISKAIYFPIDVTNTQNPSTTQRPLLTPYFKMISSASVLLALLPLALSTPIDRRNNDVPLRFGAIAARSASPVHLQTINASGQSFWIGKETATYCPLDPQSQCPPGNQTVFSTGNGGVSLVSLTPVPENPSSQHHATNPTRTSSFQAVNPSTSPPTEN
ncbi:MAG: hypothetical protein Q9180_009675, partial [Flavoplaca navasiana]